MSDHDRTAGLPDRIRFARRVAGLSTRALGRRAGLGINTIATIERGTRPDPRVSTLEAIARALDVSVEWLLLGKGEPPTMKETAS